MKEYQVLRKEFLSYTWTTHLQAHKFCLITNQLKIQKKAMCLIFTKIPCFRVFWLGLELFPREGTRTDWGLSFSSLSSAFSGKQSNVNMDGLASPTTAVRLQSSCSSTGSSRECRVTSGNAFRGCGSSEGNFSRGEKLYALLNKKIINVL